MKGDGDLAHAATSVELTFNCILCVKATALVSACGVSGLHHRGGASREHLLLSSPSIFIIVRMHRSNSIGLL